MQTYILTFSGIKFYPMEPRPEDIRIEDIAHSLSLMTRANGHFKHFFSVGQHSVNCAREAEARGYTRRIQLGCLLHDASESYISDITRPVKQYLNAYYLIEEKLQRTIYEKFGLGDLTQADLALIRSVDDALLYKEFETLMNVRLFDEPPELVGQHDFEQRDFKKVEKAFLDLFDCLYQK
jgi:5'-deoxynucleotidase YfbR-like HD superfamily hydrolase